MTAGTGGDDERRRWTERPQRGDGLRRVAVRPEDRATADEIVATTATAQARQHTDVDVGRDRAAGDDRGHSLVVRSIDEGAAHSAAVAPAHLNERATRRLTEERSEVRAEASALRHWDRRRRRCGPPNR